MPAALTIVGKILLNMAMALLTEKFVKTLIVAALRELTKKSQNELDDKLLKAAEEAWGIEPAQVQP